MKIITHALGLTGSLSLFPNEPQAREGFTANWSFLVWECQTSSPLLQLCGNTHWPSSSTSFSTREKLCVYIHSTSPQDNKATRFFQALDIRFVKIFRYASSKSHWNHSLIQCSHKGFESFTSQSEQQEPNLIYQFLENKVENTTMKGCKLHVLSYLRCDTSPKNTAGIWMPNVDFEEVVEVGRLVGSLDSQLLCCREGGW